MALVRNPLAMKLRGRAGAFSYYTENGRQIVRVAQNSSNYGPTASRSTAQQLRRVKWANLVNFYKANRSWMRGAFEYKKVGQSDYNAFMSLNIPEARVGLRKDMALHGECTVDLFRISDGSLGSFSRGFNEGGNFFQTDLKTVGFAPSDDLTIGQVAGSILKAMPFFGPSTQLSVIQAYDVQGQEGRTYVRVDAFEMMLNPEDSRKVADVFPFTFNYVTSERNIMVQGLDNTKCTAVVISDSSIGRLRVSSERLWPGSVAEAEAMSAPAWLESCVASYGVDESRFLDSGYQFAE